MKILILLSVVAFASCVPVQDDSVMRFVLGNVAECMKSDLSVCLKEQALKATERLRTVRKIDIVDGVTIYNNGPKESRSLELSAEPEVRSRQLTAQLWESTSDLVKNSELELSWAGPVDDEEESRALDTAEEGRGKKKEIKKKLKILIPLLILAKIKAVIIALVSIVVIAASLAKLAILAKIAFIAKAIAILKYLLHKKQHHHEEDHGWIAQHDVHDFHDDHSGGHGGWDGGWSRSRNEAQKIAYSAYDK